MNKELEYKQVLKIRRKKMDDKSWKVITIMKIDVP